MEITPFKSSLYKTYDILYLKSSLWGLVPTRHLLIGSGSILIMIINFVFQRTSSWWVKAEFIFKARTLDASTQHSFQGSDFQFSLCLSLLILRFIFLFVQKYTFPVSACNKIMSRKWHKKHEALHRHYWYKT